MNSPRRAAFAIAIASTLAVTGCSGEPAADDDTAVTSGPAETPAAPSAAYADLKGDAANGEKLFVQCKTCHSLEPGENRVGPSLHGVVGRAAGQVPGFNYSPANKAMGLVWSEDQLFTYLEAPQKTVPGTKMAYAGLKPPQDRADLIAYLKTEM